MARGIRFVIVFGLILNAACCDAFAQGCCAASDRESLNQLIQLSKFYFQAKRISTTAESIEDQERYTTVFEITDVLKAPEGSVKVGERFGHSDGSNQTGQSATGTKRRSAPQRGSSVLFVSDGSDFPKEASILCETNLAVAAYLASTAAAIAELKEGSDRRKIFVPYVGDGESVIADDALVEFLVHGYEGISSFKSDLRSKRLLAAFTNPKTSIQFTGAYGVLLGLCGDASDALVLEKKLVVLDADFRLGIDGVIAGYLMIKGEEGLKLVEDSKMLATTARTTDGKEVPLPFYETYAAKEALRFLWSFEPERISAARLRESMRLLLDRPELADLVITDLSKWKDWDSQDRIIAMFDDEKFKIPATKRAIVRFLYYSSQEQGEVVRDGKAVRPEHAIRAEGAMESLRKKNPKIVEDVFKYFNR